MMSWKWCLACVLVANAWLKPVSGTPGGASPIGVEVTDWSMEVHCGVSCMDLNLDDAADESDFLLVMAVAGHAVRSESDVLYCCEGLFTRDGYIDTLDLYSWDWALRDPSRPVCTVPLTTCTTCGAAASLASSTLVASGAATVGLPQGCAGLAVLGKRSGTGTTLRDILKDALYLFSTSGQYDEALSLDNDRCNVRVVQGRDGCTYLINSDTGVLRLEADGSTVSVVPAGMTTWSSDPRYHVPATISVGIQNQGSTVSGRPILDAMVVGSSVYVVPVVVSPDGNEPYVAAARLDLRQGQSPPYQVAEVYDDPGLVNKDLLDNPNLSGLREIEVDEANSVYVLNAHSHNESDVLWKYATDGTVLRSVVLDNPKGAVYVPDPIGLCVCSGQNRVYVASSQTDPDDPNSARVYGFSTVDLRLQRTVTIRGMQHVTAMTAEPNTGILWVVGYRVKGTPVPTDPLAMPESEPCLAQVLADATVVDAVSLAGVAGDLALPVSIAWTGL